MNLHTSPSAPPAVGPYSHAVSSGNLLFCSGQIPLDPESKQIVPGGIEAEVKQVMRNIEGMLSDFGAGLNQIVKSTIFVTDLNDFQVVNALYAEALGEHKPARSTVEVSALPLGASVEIEVVVELV